MNESSFYFLRYIQLLDLERFHILDKICYEDIPL